MAAVIPDDAALVEIRLLTVLSKIPPNNCLRVEAVQDLKAAVARRLVTVQSKFAKGRWAGLAHGTKGIGPGAFQVVTKDVERICMKREEEKVYV
jgi:hypothetical protein